MKLRNLFCGVMAAAMAFVACDQEADLGAPDITLSANEIVLPSEAGDTTITVKATLDWTVNVDETVEWLAIDPMGGNASNDDQTVTLSYFANDGYDREVSVAFTIGLKTKYLTVTQKGAQGSADALVIYANDFDKEEAVEIEGKGWPYLDNSEVWKNATGTGSENVTYASSGVTVRNNSNSDGKYSDYSGSGMNNIFFGKSPYFAVHGIALGEAVNFNITFGTEKYSKDNGSIFTNSEFHIWLSADGTKWVELTDYVFAGGETEGRWNVASANFSVPAGTSTLSLCFAVDVASSYRLDDLKLTVAAKEGTKIDFTSAVEKNFGSGSTGGNNNGGSDNGGNNGGGEVTPPAEITDITVEEFLKKEASETVWYRLTGTATGSLNSTYGNFDITDETGSVYVYGISNWNDYKSKFMIGDKITIVGNRYIYTKDDGTTKDEVMNAYIESWTAGPDNDGTGSGDSNGGEVDPDAGWSYKFASGDLGSEYSSPVSKTLNGVAWDFSMTGSTYLGFDNNNGRGLQMGKKAEPASEIILSTKGITGNIKKIVVNSAGASGTNAKLIVSVGGTAIGSEASMTTTPSDYTFESDAALSGEVVLKWTLSAAAVYINTISVYAE